MSTFSNIIRYPYRDPRAPDQVFFWKVRANTNDKRGKTFWYETPTHAERGLWSWGSAEKGKPEGTEHALFQVRSPYFAKKHDIGYIAWTEGEKDALACRTYGLLSVSHHGGAYKTHQEQADHFLDYHGLVLVMADRDDPGLACAGRRQKLLHNIGVRSIVLRPGNEVPRSGLCPNTRPCYCAKECPVGESAFLGADLSDHIRAGLGPAELEVVPGDEILEATERWEARLAVGASYTGHMEEWERKIVENSLLIKYGWDGVIDNG